MPSCEKGSGLTEKGSKGVRPHSITVCMNSDTVRPDPFSGLDNDAYDMLGQYPNLTVIKAVTHFAGGDKGDKKDVIQKAAASAVTHILLEI